MSFDSKTVGILAALGCAASWAMGAVLFKRLSEHLSSPGMALVKSFIAAGVLGAVLLLVGFEKVDSRSLALLILSGVVGIAIGDTLFFAALRDLSPHMMIMLMTSGQILTVLLAVIFLKEKPTARTWLGIALIVAGITVVLRANLTGEKKKSQLKGLLLGALMVICLSATSIIARIGVEEISELQGTFIRMLAAGTAMIVLCLFQSRPSEWFKPFKESGMFFQFLASVCLVAFGGFWLSLVALKKLGVSVGSTLSSVEPIFVLPLAWFFLKEKVTVPALSGSLLAVAGIFCLCRT